MPTEIYNLPDGSKIIGNIMPNMEHVSYSKKMILFHAESIYQFLIVDFEAKMKCKVGDPEKAGLMKMAVMKAGEQFQNTIDKFPLPEQLEQILTNDNLKKKEQERLLCGIKIETEHIASFFYRAEELGYEFSSLRFEGMPKDIPAEELPRFIYCKDSNVIRVGGSNAISDGKLHQLVDQQKVLITRIASNGSQWHCLLQTLTGLKGHESGIQGSKPHLHYLSNKTTGLTYDQIVAMVKLGNYPTAKIHIPLTDR